jgi:hypothetical protein
VKFKVNSINLIVQHSPQYWLSFNLDDYRSGKMLKDRGGFHIALPPQTGPINRIAAIKPETPAGTVPFGPPKPPSTPDLQTIPFGDGMMVPPPDLTFPTQRSTSGTLSGTGGGGTGSGPGLNIDMTRRPVPR